MADFRARRSHIWRLCCTAQFVAVLALTGCGTVGVFGRYDLPESPGVADAPWPRLVDTPSVPAPGTYSAAVPDPASGAAARNDLLAEAIAADAQARALSEPVIDEAERRRLTRAGRRR